ncbi:MAG: RtcB family protein [Candidatus Diapherotrites archaeon]|uniref:tRNA-splicing ligase RtcB n=2 Tax=Candidatus Iainarchaeum sp. TaxID=3101447 RepID=A0A8T4LB30_9ARCH|nr:RtcB family protein [Candidatus Diapherotrites archaeon]
MSRSELRQASEWVWELPMSGQMRVPGRVYANPYIVGHVLDEVKKGEWNPLTQLKNVACLPGLQKYALALPDLHVGYGACIGSVGAMDLQEGVIVFGLVGYDINCGLQTFVTPLTRKDVKGKEERLAEELYRVVPAGLGIGGKVRLDKDRVDEVLERGAHYAVENGLGLKEDLELMEEKGCIRGANAANVSPEAKARFEKQLGTLGSGNHYCEVQYVEQIYDEEAAKAFGLFRDQLIVSIHCGSRGLGHQVGSDYLKVLEKAMPGYGLTVPDRELACAPIQSEEGQRYLSAVYAGINCAFANREVLTHLARTCFEKTFELKAEEMPMLYGVAHNTAKLERHRVDGREKELLVQRKGATRSFGPGREEVPEKYRKVGQPVIIGGTMGTASYILKGTRTAMEETFGSTVHGAGRTMSRVGALKQWTGKGVVDELARRGIIIKGHGLKGIAEEAPGAYKDIDQVIDVVHHAGISSKVARVRPLICVKG